MSTQHATISLFAGDDWEFALTLLDENGDPYDLTNATIRWALVSLDGRKRIDQSVADITIDDPLTGVATILIPATATTSLHGQYTDYHRIVSGGVSSTLLTGTILVTGDPWYVPPSQVPLPPTRARVEYQVST
jgi:hypothetical protein